MANILLFATAIRCVNEGYSSQIKRGYGNGHVDDLRVDDIIYDDTYGAMMFTRFPAEVICSSRWHFKRGKWKWLEWIYVVCWRGWPVEIDILGRMASLNRSKTRGDKPSG